MPDPRLARMAKLIVDYSVKVKPGDKVFTHSTTAAAPLLLKLGKCILRAGGNLFLVVDVPGMQPG